MVHQPVLWGVGLLVVTLAGVSVPGGAVPREDPSAPGWTEGFLSQCQVGCETSGGSVTTCANSCRCVANDLNGHGPDDAATPRLTEIVEACLGRRTAP